MLRRKRLRCSFWGKDETQVSKFVAGPNVYICDACVTAARQIMDSTDGDDPTPKARNMNSSDLCPRESPNAAV